MYPYILFTLIIFLLGFAEKKLGKEKYLIISFILMFIFIVSKDYNFFNDHDYYIEVFNYANKSNFIELLNNYDTEKGFLLYTYFIRLFTSNYYVFLTICAFISLIGPYIFIKNNSKNYKISLLIYFILSFFSLNYILRGSIALSFFLLGLDNLRKKKVIKYLLFILLAALFHKTLIITIILLIPYVYIQIKNSLNLKIYICYLIALMTLFLLKKQIVSFLMATLYRNYIGVEFKGGGYKLLLVICVISVVVTYIREKYMKEKDEILIDSFNLSLPFQILATDFGPINRITTYFTMSIITIIPELIELINEKNKKYVELGVYILLYIILIFKIFTSSAFFEYHLFFI